MIRSLRKKFTVTAMIAVTVLLLVILGGVNAVNAWTNAREIDALLGALCETEAGSAPPAREMPKERRGPGLWGQSPNEDSRLSALFFTVTADSGGEITAVDLRHIASVDEAEARALYAAAADGAGSVSSFRCRSAERNDGSRITVFLDVSRQRGAVLRVAALSALAGLVGWGLMLLFVRFLSKKAIQPIAENMEKQKRFVTDAGHELKTPLAIILANTEAMELRQGENKYTKNIRGQVERLSGLTQNLLTLARADEGGQQLRAETLSLSELVEESAQPFREPAALRGLSFSAAVEPGITVRADRRQLTQLVSILLDNAVKYASEGGAVSLRLCREEGKAVLRVKNTVSDASIPAERLFDRFYRADSARTQASGGYGIGLSAARAVAEAHKGSLSAAYEGDSIVFTLSL